MLRPCGEVEYEKVFSILSTKVHTYFSQLVLDQIVEKSMEKCGCIPPFLSSTLTENLPICTNQTIGKEATAIYEKYAYLIDYATNKQVVIYNQLKKNLKCVSDMISIST